jgi:UDP-glucuronate 4-epimerase
MMCHAYHKLYGMPITCLRLFTVYGPMGRPDMAYYKFTNALLEGKEVTRFGDGSMKRDFTFVDDIVPGVLAALDKPLDFEIVNLGNSKPVELNRFIAVIEKAVGKKANVKELPVPAGDVPVTYADVSKAKRLLGWEPKVTVEEGVPKFVEWYKEYAKGL